MSSIADYIQEHHPQIPAEHINAIIDESKNLTEKQFFIFLKQIFIELEKKSKKASDILKKIDKITPNHTAYKKYDIGMNDIIGFISVIVNDENYKNDLKVPTEESFGKMLREVTFVRLLISIYPTIFATNHRDLYYDICDELGVENLNLLMADDNSDSLYLPIAPKIRLIAFAANMNGKTGQFVKFST